jgi:hypothetical protein
MSKPRLPGDRHGLRSLLSWFVLASILVFTMQAHASTLGVYFDPNQPNSVLQANPFQEFQYYVAASDCGGDLYAFQFQVKVDPALTVTRRELTAAGPQTINLGSADDWVVGTGQRVSATSRVNLIAYSAMLMSAAENIHIDLGPADVDGDYYKPTPVFILYDDDERFHSFDDVRGALINGDTKSWGRLKTNYNDQ